MNRKIVNTVVSNLYSEPSFRSEMVTQAFLGEVVGVLDQSDKWFRIVCPDGYRGWIRWNTIVDNDLWEAKDGKWFTPNDSVANVWTTPEMTNIFQKVTLMSRVQLVRDDGNVVLIQLPDGKTGWMSNRPLTIFGKSMRDKIVQTAHRFLGIPYFWGGKSPFGTDCSGLMQSVFGLCGISLKRDAGEQFQMKSLVEIEFSDAETGDLYFFGEDDKIGHVGLSIGNGKILHSSGWVHIDSLIETAVDFNEQLKQTFLVCKSIRNLVR
ncbi:MAG: C40 family peptidase [Candidatus Neomarinimicrobiota bacterium]